MAFDILTVLLNGAQKGLGADNLGGLGDEYVLLQKLVSAQPGSLAALDKLIGSAYGGVGVDTGLPFAGVVRDWPASAAISGVADGEYAVPTLDPASRLHTYSDGLRKRFKDEFSGAAVDLTKWTVSTTGAGNATVAGSVLTLTTGGGTSGDGVELLSVDTFASPVRVLAIVNSISQRIANQEFSIEMVEETTVPGAVGTDAAKLLFNGTVNTTQQVTTLCTGDQDGPTNWTTQATSSATKYEIDLMPDEVWYYGVSTLNSTTNRSWYAHQDRKTPDPTKRYRIRLRLRNTGAAASTTTVNIDAVVLEDNSYVPVELAHARGSSITGEALPIIVSNSPSVIAKQQSIWYDDTSTALGASASFTGTSRDIMAVTTGGQPTYSGAVQFQAIGDQAFDLYADVSRDNVTFRRIKKLSAVQPYAGSPWVAELTQLGITRYVRAFVQNGAAAMTYFQLATNTSGMP